MSQRENLIRLRKKLTQRSDNVSQGQVRARVKGLYGGTGAKGGKRKKVRVQMASSYRGISTQDRV